MPTDDGAPRTPKAEQTRAAIVASALELFGEHGYDGTTMRAIAQRAGVSIGNAYYYFPSKEHLVQAYYGQLAAAHVAAVEEGPEAQSGFSDRLESLLLIWLDVAEPYHAFAGKFFKNAAEPTSPLSPFSDESADARATAISLHQRLVDESDLKLSPKLREALPELLWILQMGMVLFWVHDNSPDQRRTRDLVRRVAPLIDRLLRATRIPGVRRLAEDAVSIVATIKAD